jgi:hypothetical protein
MNSKSTRRRDELAATPEPTEPPQDAFNSIANDLLCHIFTFIGPAVTDAYYVCKLWRQLLRQPTVWRALLADPAVTPVCISHYNMTDPALFPDFLRKFDFHTIMLGPALPLLDMDYVAATAAPGHHNPMHHLVAKLDAMTPLQIINLRRQMQFTHRIYTIPERDAVKLLAGPAHGSSAERLVASNDPWWVPGPHLLLFHGPIDPESCRRFIMRTFFLTCVRMKQLFSDIGIPPCVRARIMHVAIDVITPNGPSDGTLLERRILDSIVMGVTYAMMKANGTRVPFKEIMTHYNVTMTPGASLLYRDMSAVHGCSLIPAGNTGPTLPNVDSPAARLVFMHAEAAFRALVNGPVRGDIIAMYNQVMLPHCRDIILAMATGCKYETPATASAAILAKFVVDVIPFGLPQYKPLYTTAMAFVCHIRAKRPDIANIMTLDQLFCAAIQALTLSPTGEPRSYAHDAIHKPTRIPSLDDRITVSPTTTITFAYFIKNIAPIELAKLDLSAYRPTKSRDWGVVPPLDVINPV